MNQSASAKSFNAVNIIIINTRQPAPSRVSWLNYAFVGVSLSDAKFMGGVYLNESRNAVY